MLTEKPLIRQFYLGQIADLTITSAALATQRAIEVNPIGFDEKTAIIKLAATSALILLYAASKDKNISWEKPLEHGMQFGTFIVWLVVLSNIFTVASTLG